MLVMVAMEKKMERYYEESIVVFFNGYLKLVWEKIKSLILSRGDQDTYDNINRKWEPLRWRNWIVENYNKMCFENFEHGFHRRIVIWNNGIDVNYLAKRRVETVLI